MERLLQDLIDLLPVGVWVADVHGELVRTNRAARRIWRGEPPSGKGRLRQYKGWWVETGEPVLPQEWGLSRAIRRGESSEGELIRIRCFDGTQRTVLASAAPLYNSQGTLTGAVAINEDVTDIEGARERSREREHLLQTVLDLLPVGVWLLDDQDDVVRSNPAARSIWGIAGNAAPSDLGQFRARRAATGAPVAADDWASSRAVREGLTTRDELLEIRGFDDCRRTILNSAAPLLGEGGEPIGAVAVNQDVSSLYRVQQQLRAAVRDREQLLAIVAHDLRSPLASAMLAAGMIREAAGRLPGADVQSLAAAMERRLESIAGLVDDLLAVAVTSIVDASVLNLERVTPEQLVGHAFEQARDMFYSRGLDLRTDVSPDLPEILVDPPRMQRVLTNLLDNALKHTEQGGTVTVCAQPSRQGVQFAVENTGAPVSAQVIDSMFQPFWQARHDHTGAGLGLSICRAIVEAHGGSIWAEPVPGRRVCVKFDLPSVQLAQVVLRDILDK